MVIEIRPIIPPKKLFNTTKAFAALTEAVRDVVVEGQRRMARYPTQRPSKYVRTGTLKRSWSHVLKSGGGRIEGIVGSASTIAPYNRDVQGTDDERMQLFVERGWLGITRLGESMSKHLIQLVEKAIKRGIQ